MIETEPVLSDELVSTYLGLTPEQVRLIRLQRDIHQCAGCRTVHPSYPRIVFYHSPICTEQGKCRICGEAMPKLPKGHEVGLICEKCY